MTAANLGTKRQCPKCAAKFYDFGAADPITCPKCAKTWREQPADKPKPAKPKKEKAAPVKKKATADFDGLQDGLPEVEDGDELEDLEPIEEEEVEMTSLEEVEEHDEGEEVDPNSDDAEDEMFTEMVGEEKLVDDLEEYIETDADHEEDDGEEE